MGSVVRRLLLFITILVVCLVGYYTLVSFSESKRFSKNSLEYILLMPSVIKNQPIDDSYGEHYFYSAADGNKPGVYAVTFSSKGTQEDAQRLIVQYLNSNGFVEQEPNLFEKNDTEISIEYLLNRGQDIGITISMIEYIN